MPIAMGGGRMEQGKFLCFFSLFFPIRILGWVEVDRRKEIIGSRGGRQTCTWVDHFGRKKRKFKDEKNSSPRFDSTQFSVFVVGQITWLLFSYGQTKSA